MKMEKINLHISKLMTFDKNWRKMLKVGAIEYAKEG